MARLRVGTAALLALCLGLGAIAGCGGSSTEPSPPFTVAVPFGFPELPDDPGNPLRPEGIELGRRLFYEKALSADSTQACASCHVQAFAFTDRGRAFSVGVDGIEGTRSAMAVINPGWLRDLFWDGRAAGLEAQASAPVPNPIEMHLDWGPAVARLAADSGYPDRFAAVFGSPVITRERTVAAIAQFERTLISGDSRYDRFRRGELILTPAETRGLLLFFSEAADCFHCHGEPFFTDGRFHNNGLDSDFTDTGLEAISGRAVDRGKFRTPTLRNIAVTAPYMHDGRFKTLEEVIGHYNSGGVFSETVDPLIRVGRGLKLSEDDVADLTAFLESLTDSTFLTNPAFGDPFR